MSFRVLVVEDEPGVRLTLAANLELEGFEVDCAEDGEQALAQVAANRPDVVLSDIRMPGMSGVELFQRLKAGVPELPVVLMTAFAMEGHVQEAVDEGVYAILPKPFEVDHLARTISRAGRRPVVLVIDGSPDEAAATASELSAVGVRARAVSEASEAVRLVGEGKADVCVTDIVDAGAKAEALVEEIRRADPWLCVIGVSRSKDPERMARVARGVFAFLQKPFSIRDLIETVARARAMEPAH